MGGPLFLRASAGSGKTYRLTLEYLKILLQKPEHFRSILAITFTNDATAEMKSRIQEELRKLVNEIPGSMADKLEDIGPPALLAQRAKEALTLILHDYTHFSVMTIDGFFQMVLRSFSRELQLPIGYAVELDHDNVLQFAIQSLLAEIGREPTLTTWLIEYAKNNLEEGKTWNIEKQTAEVAQELFKEISQHREWEKTQVLGETLTGFQQELWKLIKTFDQKMIELGIRGTALVARFGVTEQDVNRGMLVKYFDKIQHGDYDPKAIVGSILSGEATVWKNSANPEAISRIEDCLLAGLQDVLNDIAITLEDSLVRYNTARAALRHLYNLGILGWMQRYIRQYRQEENALMISDTLSLLGSLVSNENTPFIYEKIGTRYRHILIDEFQDTSAQQWSNLLPLIEHLLGQGGKVLVVGDAKQSIYRWRGGDMNLILSKAPDDLYHFVPVHESLDTNFRSREGIVGFNNELFQWLTEQMDLNTEGRLSQVYADSAQHARSGPEKEGGYVSLRLFEDEEGNSRMDQSLQHVVQIIRDAISRGFKAGDIGILVRNNALAETIADTLVRNQIDVVTPQSLLLGGDERIKLLVAAMQVVSRPGVSLFTATVIQKYAIVHHLSDLDDATIFERKMTDLRLGPVVNFLQKMQELIVLPLDELNEWLIQHLLPGVEADAFFLAWQDVVSRFIGDGSARLQAFLEWWEEKGSTTTVQVPDSPHAVKLMTIHKSKGLQFPVVILPSVQWTLKPNPRQLLWVDADEMPYQKVPYIPVTCSSSLEQTFFAADYREECLTTLIDSINMLYVACTRAVDELYLLCPMVDMSKKSSDDFSDVSHFFNAGAPAGLAGLNAEDFLTYFLGAPVMPGMPKERTGQPPIPTYMSSTLATKVNMKTFTDEAAIQKGVAWHLMLAEITSSGQIGAVVRDFIARQPGIDETEETIVSRIRDILELEAALVQPSFNTFMAERDLLWHGEILRPDKIYLDGQQCLIIDYKTGQSAGSHLSQVRKYRQAMTACGFQVASAWLIYTDSLETVAVE